MAQNRKSNRRNSSFPFSLVFFSLISLQMVVRKGTPCVIDYCVYEVEDESQRWVLIEHSLGFDPTGLRMVDERTMFRFRFGMGELHAPLEEFIGQHESFYAKHGKLVYAVKRSELSGNLHMSLDEIFTELITLKNIGNEFLKKGEVETALASYEEGIALMSSPDFNRRTEKDIKEVFVPLHLNKALCCLKLSRFGDCIQSCSEVLEVDRNNVKALYRRGVARIENKELGPGKRDLLCALDLEPQNQDVIHQLDRLKQVDLEERRLYARMVNKEVVNREPSIVRIVMELNNSERVIEVTLKDSEVPRTVENFKNLLPQYAGCEIFKLVKDQFFQTGDFEFNDGSGGNCAIEPDRTVRNRTFMNDESLIGTHDRQGIVGMSNYGPNSNGSQFYITLGPCTHLDGKHVVFGEVTGGFGVLEEVNTFANSDVFETTPLAPLIIKGIELVRG